MTKFFANTARYVVLVAAVLMALGVFGIETTSFAAVLAAAGFAVGMALSGTLSNFAAGIMLLTFRPFKVGDVVEVAGETGTSTSTAFSRAASDHARWCMTRSRQVQPLPVLPPAGMRRSLPMGPPSPPTAQR